MITRLAIRNYQSLVNVTLDLGRITIIVGQTDSGKSALLRALERACFNDSGYDFLTATNTGAAEKAQVAIQMPDKVIIWERTRTTAGYRLVEQGTEKKYAKLGRAGIPDDIVTALGVKELQVDTGSGAAAFQRIQFVGQFDQPFLVGDRGGVAAARVLGHLTGIHILANAGKRAHSAGASLGQTVELHLVRELKLKGELVQYEGAEQRQAQLLRLKEHLAASQKKQHRLRQFKALQLLRDQVQTAMAKIQFSQVLLDRLEQLRQLFVKLWNRLPHLERLKRIQVQRLDLAERIRFMVIPQITAQDRFNDLQQQMQQLTAMKRHQEWLRQSHLQANAADTRIGEAEAGYLQAKHEVERFAQQFPLCPFEQQFVEQTGEYRCGEIMQVIKLRVNKG